MQTMRGPRRGGLLSSYFKVSMHLLKGHNIQSKLCVCVCVCVCVWWGGGGGGGGGQSSFSVRLS